MKRKKKRPDTFTLVVVEKNDKELLCCKNKRTGEIWRADNNLAPTNYGVFKSTFLRDADIEDIRKLKC